MCWRGWCSSRKCNRRVVALGSPTLGLADVMLPLPLTATGVHRSPTQSSSPAAQEARMYSTVTLRSTVYEYEYVLQ